MQTTTAAEAPPAAPALDEPFRQTLPPVVVGETREVAREHGWPGNLFVILSYVTAVGLAGSAVGSALWSVATGSASLAGWAVVAGVGSVLQWRLARAVEKSTRWGWYGAMAELGVAAAAKLWAFSTGEFAGPAIGVAIDALWMSYFWERRDQFDVDVEL